MASKINLAPTIDWITCALNVWQNSLKKPKTKKKTNKTVFLKLFHTNKSSPGRKKNPTKLYF